MLLLIFVFFLNQACFSDATSVSIIPSRDTGSGSDSNSDRTIWNIIWSCLSTIFLCTWVTMHPNIAFTPERHGMGWREEWLWGPLRMFRKHKLPLFLWALIFPEWILAWSVRQWIMAGRIGKRVPGGTRTHGFFVVMGGFHLFEQSPTATETNDGHTADPNAPPHNPRDDEIPVHPLGIDDLPQNLIIPTENEIKDRGKSDGLAKFIVIVQTSWFVTQCIARGIRHLHLTELEIVTLAYTIMNFATYVFWWHKPRDVGCPIRVYRESRVTRSRARYSGGGIIWLLERIFRYLTGEEDQIVQLSRENAVPMFWSGISRAEDGMVVSMSSNLGPTILGIGFGATHFIAWLYEFPSHAELMLWRISCIIMVVIPLMSALACVGFVFNRQENPGKIHLLFLTVGLALGVLAVVIGAWLYLLSRIATIVMAFTTLRSLPADAYKGVDWTTFIPHV